MVKVTWQAEDGYAGGLRPHEVIIDDDEFEMCETQGDRKILIDEIVKAEFDSTISFSIIRVEEG